MKDFSQDEIVRMRNEMWTQFAPAVELPVPKSLPKATGQIVRGDFPEESSSTEN